MEIPGDLTAKWALLLPSTIETCLQRRQDNAAPVAGLQDSLGDKGAVGLTSPSWVLEEALGQQASPGCAESFRGG